MESFDWVPQSVILNARGADLIFRNTVNFVASVAPFRIATACSVKLNGMDVLEKNKTIAPDVTNESSKSV